MRFPREIDESLFRFVPVPGDVGGNAIQVSVTSVVQSSFPGAGIRPVVGQFSRSDESRPISDRNGLSCDTNVRQLYRPPR